MTGVRAVILAGGQGSRLRPLTLERAKPVVPVLNRPFLAHQLAWLRAHGISDVVLACSYRVEDVQAALGDAAGLGVRLRYAVEPEPLGTGGGLRHAVEPGPGAVLALNGDVLTDADLGAMARFHTARGARATILLTRVADPRPYGLVELEPDGRVRRFREKPGADEPVDTDTVNAGVYLIEAALLARLPPGRAASIEREFFPALVADGVACFGCPTAAYWRDIGSPADYHAAQMDLLHGRVRMALAPPGQRRDGCWVAPDAAVAAGARLAAPAVVGARVRVAAGARVGPAAVLGDGSRVEADARVAAAVLWEDVVVGPGAVLDGCVVGARTRVGARAHVGAGVVLATGAVVPAHATLTR